MLSTRSRHALAARGPRAEPKMISAEDAKIMGMRGGLESRELVSSSPRLRPRLHIATARHRTIGGAGATYHFFTVACPSLRNKYLTQPSLRLSNPCIIQENPLVTIQGQAFLHRIKERNAK
eukprot:scaffold55062_cov30-Tisochrysis_lutea.AAC.5